MTDPNNRNQTKRFFQTQNVILIAITHFVHDVYTAFLAPVLPLITEKLSISYSLVGFLNVIQSVPSLLNPFIGIVADRIKIKYLVIAMPAITTIVMSLIGIAPNYWMLAILIFIAGMSSTFFHVPAPVFMRKVSGESVGKGMSFFMVGGEIARTLGPIIILAGVSYWGLEGTYRLMPFGIITTSFLFFKFRNINIPSEPKKQNKAFETLKHYMRFFIIISGIMFFRASMKSALTYYLPSYLKESGDSLWLAGIALSVIQLAGTVGTFSSGIISDKIGRKNALLIITAITPILMWAFLLVGKDYTFIILILSGFFLFASSPVILALVNEIKSERPAFINGIFMTLNFAIGSTGVMLVGYLTDKIGFEQAYRITAYLAFGSFPFALMLRKSR